MHWWILLSVWIIGARLQALCDSGNAFCWIGTFSRSHFGSHYLDANGWLGQKNFSLKATDFICSMSIPGKFQSAGRWI
jgi:hypothetical protein